MKYGGLKPCTGKRSLNLGVQRWFYDESSPNLN